MTRYEFATSLDGDKFLVEGMTLQGAFKSLSFEAEKYAESHDEAEEMRGQRIDVWAWDETGDRHDWAAYLT